MINNKYDVIIIGAGPGGYEAALYASENGLKVLLVEEKELGGVCLNCGCIPTKSYYATANLINQMNSARDLSLNATLFIDFLKVRERKDRVVDDLKKGIRFMLEKAGVTFVNGFGKLISKNEVLVNDVAYSGTSIIIATGSSNLKSVIKGHEYTIDSTEILKLDNLPKSLTMIGGGVIGIEIASILAVFGVSVSIIEMQDNILPTFDLEISRRLSNYLKQLRIKIITKAKVLEVQEKAVIYQVKEQIEKLDSDVTMLAIGRKPNIDNLGLDNLGIAYNKKGIEVNEHFQTNVNHIYAIGDCNGKILLAHYATSSGKYVIDRLIGRANSTDFSVVPGVVFTFPEVASVGITEEEVIKKGLPYKVNKVMYRSGGMAVASNVTEGFIKSIICDDYLVGLHIIGADAASLIHEASIVMNAKLKTSEVSDYIFAHPTLSEILRDALKK